MCVVRNISTLPAEASLPPPERDTPPSSPLPAGGLKEREDEKQETRAETEGSEERAIVVKTKKRALVRSLSLAKQGRGSNAWREKGAASGQPKDDDKDDRAMATGMRPYATSV
jgi:hypothetical protein